MNVTSLTCYLSNPSFDLALYCSCKLIWMLLCSVDNEDINLLLRRQESISFFSWEVAFSLRSILEKWVSLVLRGPETKPWWRRSAQCQTVNYPFNRAVNHAATLYFWHPDTCHLSRRLSETLREERKEKYCWELDRKGWGESWEVIDTGQMFKSETEMALYRVCS